MYFVELPFGFVPAVIKKYSQVKTMIATTITILRKGEQEAPALTQIPIETKTVVGDLERMVIIEGGMQSGATSIAFQVKMPDGSYVIAETTAKLFRAMAGTLEGAEQRFSETL